VLRNKNVHHCRGTYKYDFRTVVFDKVFQCIAHLWFNCSLLNQTYKTLKIGKLNDIIAISVLDAVRKLIVVLLDTIIKSLFK